MSLSVTDSETQNLQTLRTNNVLNNGPVWTKMVPIDSSGKGLSVGANESNWCEQSYVPNKFYIFLKLVFEPKIFRLNFYILAQIVFLNFLKLAS